MQIILLFGKNREGSIWHWNPCLHFGWAKDERLPNPSLSEFVFKNEAAPWKLELSCWVGDRKYTLPISIFICVCNLVVVFVFVLWYWSFFPLFCFNLATAAAPPIHVSDKKYKMTLSTLHAMPPLPLPNLFLMCICICLQVCVFLRLYIPLSPMQCCPISPP